MGWTSQALRTAARPQAKSSRNGARPSRTSLAIWALSEESLTTSNWAHLMMAR